LAIPMNFGTREKGAGPAVPPKSAWGVQPTAVGESG